MEEVSRINSIVLAYGEYLLTATSTAVYHLPSHAADGGNHTAALAPSLLLDDLSGGCDCPAGRDCAAAWSTDAFLHCGHYLVGEFKLADGRPALMIHNQDPAGAQVNATACKRHFLVFTPMAWRFSGRRWRCTRG